MLAVAVLALPGAPGCAHAQEERTSGGWGSLSLGLGTGNPTSEADEVTQAIVLEGVYWRGAHLFALHAAGVFEMFDGGATDVGVLYGLRAGGRGGHISATAGLSVVSVDLDCSGGLFSELECESDTTVGVPVSVDAVVHSSWIGFGVKAFATFNSLSTYLGATLTLQVGRLR